MGKWIGSTATSLFLLLLFQGWAAGATEKTLKHSENQLQQIEGLIKTLRADLNQSGAIRSRLSAELQESEKLIGLSAKRLHQIDKELHRQQARLDDLEKEYRGQLEALQVERQALTQQVRAAYAMGRQQRLKILLNQQDPAIVSRLMVYYDYFNKARLEQMGRIRQSMAGLQRVRAEIGSERAQLLELQSSALAEREQQEINRQQRQAVVDSLSLEMRDKGERLAALMKDQEQLQALLKQLHQQQLATPLEQTETQPISALKGKLRWPVKGRVRASFGTAKAGNLKWDGMIIAAPEGREVHAIHRGRVAFADWLRGFGLLMIIDHGGGYMSLYGHNQSLFRETGEWVEAGERVALVGNSGGRSDFGVYFGIRVDGNPVNPKKWCERIKKGNRISFSPVLNSQIKSLSNGLSISAERARVRSRGIRQPPRTGSAVQQASSQVLDKV